MVAQLKFPKREQLRKWGVHCPVFKNDKLVWRKKKHGGGQVFVKTLTGKTITFDVDFGWDVRRFKQMIKWREGIREDQLRVVFRGFQLEDGNPLWKYKLTKECTVHMVLKLRGGMYHESSGRNGFEATCDSPPEPDFYVAIIVESDRGIRAEGIPDDLSFSVTPKSTFGDMMKETANWVETKSNYYNISGASVYISRNGEETPIEATSSKNIRKFGIRVDDKIIIRQCK